MMCVYLIATSCNKYTTKASFLMEVCDVLENITNREMSMSHIAWSDATRKML